MSALRSGGRALVTGGAGFVGINVADRLLRDGWRVRLFDNLSRAGVCENLEWLRRTHARDAHLEIVIGDVRDQAAVTAAVEGVDRIFHFAAQVAVTTSLDDPDLDFAVNAGGTLHVLQAVRAMPAPASLLFTSTNKVYGHLEALPLRVAGRRYEVRGDSDVPAAIAEDQPLAFCSPYGCSKGAADQYVIDYARTFGLAAAVFRMSCIYGPHQCGTEDQGWVAHFVRNALDRSPLTVYGDGRQVRDALYVDDLIDAMLLAHESMPRLAGRAFNIGGGPGNTVSVLELIDLLSDIVGTRVPHRLEDWRTADQRYYVSDTSRFTAATGWTPRVPVRSGIERLIAWMRARRTGRTNVRAARVAS